MKNTKIKIILSAIICLSVVGFVGKVNAAGPSLYVSPATLTKTAGSTFSVSAGINASGSKVCAVEGTLVFNNLSCQSITLASDVMAQSSPTCSNPYFLIGIPNCTTSDKTLLTLSVRAGSAGTASINATGVDIIGEGASVGSASTSGNYTINAVLTSTPTITPTPTPAPKTTLTPKTTQQITTPTPTPTPTKEVAPEETTTPAETEQTAGLMEAVRAKSFLASLGNTLFSPTAIWIMILIVILGVGYTLYSKMRKKKR
jgi:hypothetical protein